MTNRIVVEEHHDLCIHAYTAWVVIEESTPPKMVKAGEVRVTVSPFAGLAGKCSVVSIEHSLARMNCRFPSEQDAYAEALFDLGRVAEKWETKKRTEEERLIGPGAQPKQSGYLYETTPAEDALIANMRKVHDEEKADKVIALMQQNSTPDPNPMKTDFLS